MGERSNGNLFAVSDTSGMPIAFTTDRRFANLIFAAPDLLTALTGIMRIMPEMAQVVLADANQDKKERITTSMRRIMGQVSHAMEKMENASTMQS